MLEGALEFTGCHGHFPGGAGVAVGEITLNSHGVRYTSRQSDVSISLEAISGQSTGYEFDHAFSRSQVNPQRVGEQAACLASRSAGGKDIPYRGVQCSPFPHGICRPALWDLCPGSLREECAAGSLRRLPPLIGKPSLLPLLSFFDDPQQDGATGARGLMPREHQPAGSICQGRRPYRLCLDLKTAYGPGCSPREIDPGRVPGLPAIGHHNFVVDGKRDVVFDDRQSMSTVLWGLTRQTP